jgi:hypothetical protein
MNNAVPPRPSMVPSVTRRLPIAVADVPASPAYDVGQITALAAAHVGYEFLAVFATRGRALSASAQP